MPNKKMYWKHRKKYLKYNNEYNKRPEVKERRKKYHKKRMKNPKIKEHIKKYQEKYYLKNKEKIDKKNKNYYYKNCKKIRKQNKGYYKRPEVKERIKKYQQIPEVKERIKKYLKEYHKKWYLKNKSKIKKYQQKYYKRLEVKERKLRKQRERWRLKKKNNDKQFIIKQRLKSLFRKTLQKYTKEGKIYSCKKYGINFKAMIEHLKPFPGDLSKYEIDHKKPLCSFDLTDKKQIKQAFSPKNLQWLTIHENRSKGGRY